MKMKVVQVSEDSLRKLKEMKAATGWPIYQIVETAIEELKKAGLKPAKPEVQND